MKKIHIGTVELNQKIADETYKLVISSSVDDILPGQFISILIPNKTLRRPFSAAGFKNGKIVVMYKIKGEGTKYIQSLKPADKINFLGPFGNSFNLNYKNALLIGAGIGIAPMLYLKYKLNIPNYLITGFKKHDEIIEGSDENVIGGSVLDNIEKIIEAKRPDIIYSCGPSIVLKMVSEIGIKKGIETQIAMEKTMACGIGVCRGCIIELQNGKNAAVCKDGPVFFGKDIKWRI